MNDKNRITALLLCIFGFFLGLHNWYLGNYKRAVLFTITIGGFGIWWIYDIIKIVTDTRYIEHYNGEYTKGEKENQFTKRIENQAKIDEIKQKMAPINDDVVRCPKCGSSQLSANKKGFSLGKAVAGGVLLVPIAGVATGMIGKNKIIITCLNCGKHFKPGTK
ncbi:TM2 domain-containing protein [Clostridium sp.]|uniref:TM2 domain-containing protein n=1 Tax=Clostridium sp. TaxID=1506 RepID=UPI00290C3133|nr:TM2 domain-containing protein [Clostridium sp.]MDU5106532.1 TM2 domain-containing protein [Clostridium sp.]